jgi:hypothetical protein
MKSSAYVQSTPGEKKCASPQLFLDLSIFMGFGSRGLEQTSALITFTSELRSYQLKKPIV